MRVFGSRISRLTVGVVVLAAAAVAGSTPTSLTLTASPNPGVYGQIVTLTAAVSSSSATGKVTFYDGVTMLETAPVYSGLATLFTTAVPSGGNSIWAYYGGDSTYAASNSAALSETITTVSGIFQSVVSINAQSGGVIAVADFNGDGNADLVVGGSQIFLGNGDGTFRSPINFTVGHCFFPRTLAVGDFNGDGKPDLAVGESCSGVNILLGNGDGTFQSPVSYATGGDPPFVAVGDFNGDGLADLMTGDECFGGTCSQTAMLLGNGDGTFRNGGSFGFTGSISVGDFNGDGKADLVTGGGIYLGNGNGTFQSPLSFGIVNNYCAANCGLDFIPASAVVGDFNGDGRADLVIPDSRGSTVTVLLGNGNGTFQTAVYYAVGSNPISISAGDFNGDGKLDLAVANSGNGVSVLLGNGDGTFQAAKSYPSGMVGGTGSIVSGAFAGNSRASLAFSAAVYSSTGTGAGLSVLLNTAPTPDLAIAKSHGGNFAQGQVGASYTVTVSNIGAAATSSVVTVTDSLPTGLTATAISGSGWNCVVSTASCTRSDTLAGSASYPAITVTVNVAANALASLTNAATVSGGGETNTSNDTVSDVTAINITATSQTITFTALPSQTLGVGLVTLTGTASSGLTVNYISTTTSVCTVLGSSVTLLTIGTCSIVATQGGNAQYAVAPPVTQSFLVKNPQTITFTTLANVVFGPSAISLTATASSGLTVMLVSGTPLVCTVTNFSVTLLGVGICSITATQAGSTTYAAATNITQTFTISQGSQTITFGVLSNITLTVPSFPITATSTSGLAVSFVSTTPSICVVSGTTLTPLAGGACSITAIQTGTANYLPATPVSQSFNILGPAVTPSGITPIYSSSSTIQPGSWISIYGTGFSNSTAVWTGNFPISLGGVTVTIDGRSAYLYYVSPTQINLQAPDDTAAGSVDVVVTNSNGSTTSTVTLAPVAPALMLLDSKHATGIILRSNGSGAYGNGTYDIVGPTGSSLGYSTVAAKAGDSLALFGVGFGPTTPTVSSGQPFSGAASTTNAVQLAINGQTVTPSFAGLSSAGLYQINLTLPAGMGTGDVSLAATVGGVQTQSGVVISLQ